MGGRVVIEDLRPYQNALNQLGAPILTLERLINLMATAFASHEAGVSEIPDQKVEGFYRPLWSIVNDPVSYTHLDVYKRQGMNAFSGVIT